MSIIDSILSYIGLDSSDQRDEPYLLIHPRTPKTTEDTFQITSPVLSTLTTTASSCASQHPPHHPHPDYAATSSLPDQLRIRRQTKATRESRHTGSKTNGRKARNVVQNASPAFSSAVLTSVAPLGFRKASNNIEKRENATKSVSGIVPSSMFHPSSATKMGINSNANIATNTLNSSSSAAILDSSSFSAANLISPSEISRTHSGIGSNYLSVTRIQSTVPGPSSALPHSVSLSTIEDAVRAAATSSASTSDMDSISRPITGFRDIGDVLSLESSPVHCRQASIGLGLSLSLPPQKVDSEHAVSACDFPGETEIPTPVTSLSVASIATEPMPGNSDIPFGFVGSDAISHDLDSVSPSSILTHENTSTGDDKDLTGDVSGDGDSPFDCSVNSHCFLETTQATKTSVTIDATSAVPSCTYAHPRPHNSSIPLIPSSDKALEQIFVSRERQVEAALRTETLLEHGLQRLDRSVFIVQDILAQSEGRDKLFKLLQSLAKIGRFHYREKVDKAKTGDFTEKLSLETDKARLDAFETTHLYLKVTRTNLKMFNTSIFIRLFLRVLRFESFSWLKIVALARLGGLAVYFAANYPIWLHQNRIVPNLDVWRWKRVALAGYLVSASCSFIIDSRRIFDVSMSVRENGTEAETQSESTKSAQKAYEAVYLEVQKVRQTYQEARQKASGTGVITVTDAGTIGTEEESVVSPLVTLLPLLRMTKEALESNRLRDAELLARKYSLRSKLTRMLVNFFKDNLDFAGGLDEYFYLGWFDDRAQGMIGVITSIISLYRLWRRKKNEVLLEEAAKHGIKPVQRTVIE